VGDDTWNYLGGVTMRSSVKIGPSFFVNELKDYDNWKWEFERTPEGRVEAVSLFEGFQC